MTTPSHRATASLNVWTEEGEIFGFVVLVVQRDPSELEDIESDLLRELISQCPQNRRAI